MEQFKIKKNLKKRIFAALIDYTVFFLMFYIYLLFFGAYDHDGSLKVHGWKVLPLLIIWLGYFVIFEGIFGGTLGHLALGLKVTKLDRRDIGIEQAFLRHIADPLDIYFWGLVALITINFSEKHQRLGDLIAKTIVIDTGDQEQYKQDLKTSVNM